MGIVLPDGILSNPNTESVREWILNHFIVLASVDLPVETFLPQVGVQASLLFLQKKTKIEMLRSIKDEDYQVFMAIAESVGKDRRELKFLKEMKREPKYYLMKLRKKQFTSHPESWFLELER